MKNISELTDEEILQLTDADLELMVKFQMAKEGYKILPQPEAPIYEELPKPNITGYKVRGCEFIFTDINIANHISSELINVADYAFEYKYRPSNYDKALIKKVPDLGSISSELYYDLEAFDLIENKAKLNKKIKDNYESELNDYNEAYEQSSQIRDEIWNKYYEVINKYQDFKKLKNLYNEYLLLSNSDKKIAMSFLKKAYNVSDEAETFINKI
jgi:hypothetical protein